MTLKRAEARKLSISASKGIASFLANLKFDLSVPNMGAEGARGTNSVDTAFMNQLKDFEHLK